MGGGEAFRGQMGEGRCLNDWGLKGPQLGQSSFCSCFALLIISKVSLQPQISV